MSTFVPPSNDLNSTAIAVAHAILLGGAKGIPPHVNDPEKLAEYVGKMAGLMLKAMRSANTSSGHVSG